MHCRITPFIHCAVTRKWYVDRFIFRWCELLSISMDLFEKFYPRDDLRHFGRRVREICESNDGTLWIGTEDKGLFNYDPANGKIVPFDHPAIYKMFMHFVWMEMIYGWALFPVD